MSITHSSANSVNGGIPLTKMNGKTVDISKYLDFGSMAKSGSRIILVYLLVNLGGA